MLNPRMLRPHSPAAFSCFKSSTSSGVKTILGLTLSPRTKRGSGSGPPHYAVSKPGKRLPRGPAVARAASLPVVDAYSRRSATAFPAFRRHASARSPLFFRVAATAPFRNLPSRHTESRAHRAGSGVGSDPPARLVAYCRRVSYYWRIIGPTCGKAAQK